MPYLNKLLFSVSLIVGTLIAISSYSWMGMWMGLEINLLSFMPLICSNKNIFSSESALKYFITQAMASSILLLSLILFSINSPYFINSESTLNMILNTSLLLKMGAAPLHFWFPEVMEGLSWMNSFVLLTWQKIAPMALLLYSSKTTYLILMTIISCMIVSGIMGQNQLSLRKIMAYSSINHIGWMLAAMMFLETVWLFYFLVYSIITLNILIMFKKLNIFSINQMATSINSQPHLKLFFSLNFLSLGGLPPFLGFFPKWLTIQILINTNLFLLSTIMILATLMTLFFYIQLIFSALIFSFNTFPPLKKTSRHMFFVTSSNLVALMSLILTTLAFNLM
uniref:NADH-ubiquinone oxidoreductase chain 2 n=2 Tax=Lucanus TaxID=41108 RepID=A0A650BYL1_LUCCE|nr:NADH dehydrogenase subunit 2 [Lucanus cervus]APO08633.1 NADH dehydrogenase subunit 2 [Lucanus sp. BMNH 1425267]QDW75830.1 NADH dehydrogenase subunit 2 [Lucanus cervus]QGQ62197.1 NADH dehydrogenase subunit 2 [Lucanus cervus]UIN24718.1 NADH dehydrogenase subunit 2 [Lucanus cervus]